MRYAFSVPAGQLDLGKIAASGQSFRWISNDDDSYDIPISGDIGHVMMRDGALIIDGTSLPRKAWHAYFDLGLDYGELSRRFSSLESVPVDKAMSIAQGIRSLNQPFFESCIAGLTSQNNNIKNITASLRRLCRGEKEPFPDAAQILERLAEDDCSLGYRIGYIREFCSSYLDGQWEELRKLSPFERALDGRDPLAPQDKPVLDEVVSQLRQANGIGPKVANIIALFSLGYDDAIPRDVWIKRSEGAGVIWDSQYAGVQQQFVFYAAVNGLLLD